MRLGLNDIGKTLMEFAAATMIVCSIAALIGLIGICVIRPADHKNEAVRKHWIRLLSLLLIGSSILLIGIFLTLGTHVYVSPLRVLPILCGLLIFGYLQKGLDWRYSPGPLSVFLLSVYCLVVLARVITRVPSGGAYALLLPIPLLTFLYVIAKSYPRLFSRFRGAEQLTRVFVLILCSLSIAVTLFATARRFCREPRFTLQTDRGTMRVEAEVGPAFHAALNFIEQNTKPQEFILGVPEGGCLNFLAARPTPLRYEVLTPGFLDSNAEKYAIQQLQEKRVKFVFLINRPTPEFGATAFGRDYYRELMRWIELNYDLASIFGQGVSDDSTIGNKNFFIKCYRLRS